MRDLNTLAGEALINPENKGTAEKDLPQSG